MGNPDTISSRQRDWQLIYGKSFPFLIGMNDIAPPRLPPRRGMDDGAAMVLVLKRGERK
ncbi:hypothetical protein [Bradyrhizobium erythrophlei]|uniref:Uncharacterized protein n=1 Tax=Bradyrhizobium erythrophlei TaxID=1437360 RepID=A0A1M5NS11_9BRAD|nr:hypothetical protein [Bradyrhizobium erythrophlei]SHG92394.1 hypothetical protein SAMN05444169_4816 [Bradyrhizobium erythrophlei]